jgi:hypothetical protein
MYSTFALMEVNHNPIRIRYCILFAERPGLNYSVHRQDTLKTLGKLRLQVRFNDSLASSTQPSLNKSLTVEIATIGLLYC